MSSEADRMLDEIHGAPAAPMVLKNGIRYSHAAMIDLLISQPWLKQNDLARHFGKTASWISTIMHSDAWKAAFEARKDEIVDPALRLSLEEHTRGLYARSLTILQEKLNADSSNVPDQLAIQVFAQSARALGYGARQAPTVQVNVVTEIEKHGDNLVTLLRKTKQEIYDGETTGSGPGPHRESSEAHSGSAERGEAASPVQPALRSEGSG